MPVGAVTKLGLMAHTDSTDDLPTAKEQSVMPPKKATLPDHIKEAVLDELTLNARSVARALEDHKVRIHLAVQQGVTTYEIAERLGKSQTTISTWSQEGAEARDRRRSVNPDGHGERQPVG